MGVFLALSTLFALSCPACATTEATRRDYEDGSSIEAPPAASLPHGQLSIVRIDYLSKRIVVTLRLRQEEDGPPLTLEREASLLAHRDLEYPPTAIPGEANEAVITVQPGRTRELRLTYALGYPLHDRATLVLRGLREGETYLDTRQLEISPRPLE